jgi:hypothetical protein
MIKQIIRAAAADLMLASSLLLLDAQSWLSIITIVALIDERHYYSMTSSSEGEILQPAQIIRERWKVVSLIIIVLTIDIVSLHRMHFYDSNWFILALFIYNSILAYTSYKWKLVSN